MTEFCTTHASEPATGHCATCSRSYCGLCMVEELSTELAFCSETCRVAQRYGAVSGLSDRFITALQRRSGDRLDHGINRLADGSV